MRQSSELARDLRDDSEVEELVDDLDSALKAVAIQANEGLSARAQKFAESLEKGEVPKFDDPEIQELVHCWARMYSSTIADLRRQYLWFLQ